MKVARISLGTKRDPADTAGGHVVRRHKAQAMPGGAAELSGSQYQPSRRRNGEQPGRRGFAAARQKASKRLVSQGPERESWSWASIMFSVAAVSRRWRPRGAGAEASAARDSSMDGKNVGTPRASGSGSPSASAATDVSIPSRKKWRWQSAKPSNRVLGVWECERRECRETEGGIKSDKEQSSAQSWQS